MLQATYDRASKLGAEVYVITEASHSEHVRGQLPELSHDAIIVEPGRRGTANCIVMALDYISRRHDDDEPIAFIHADHHIRDTDGFVYSFNAAAKVSQENSEITLIGIEPAYPATGFGYIERGDVLDSEYGVYRVESFKEKPDFETAATYVSTGNYLWNCGYFVGTWNVFLNEINRSAPGLAETYRRLRDIEFNTEDYQKTYLALENEVIDIALIEKAQSLTVVSANFDWMDVGSFKDLHDAVERDEQGNHLRGNNIHAIDIESVYVRNEEDKPIAVIGLDNIVVVNTPDGILVARKDISHRTGEVAKKIQNQ
ncbi:MAG: manC [Candidatus Saccharibacteria bacterium]|nr:manC [Candidatus Saccharibacteria bacterium]